MMKLQKLILNKKVIVLLLSIHGVSAMQEPVEFASELSAHIKHAFIVRFLKERVVHAPTESERMWAGKLLINYLETNGEPEIKAPIPQVQQESINLTEEQKKIAPSSAFCHRGSSLFRSPAKNIPIKK